MLEFQKFSILEILTFHPCSHDLAYSFFCRMVTYVFLFGPTVKPLYQKSLNWPSLVTERATPRHKQKDFIEKETYLFHNCVLTPDIVRDEVENLKIDFNNRVKQVLFNSMLTAYYMTFVPLCFAQVGCVFIYRPCFRHLYHDFAAFPLIKAVQ